MKELMAKLHPLERKIIPFLKDGLTEKDISKLANMQEVEVIRAMQWLENKNVLKIQSNEEEIVELGEIGKKYLKDGEMPEDKLFKLLSKKNYPFKELMKIKELNPNEIQASIGLLKMAGEISINNGVVSLTGKGKRISASMDLVKKCPINYNKLNDKELITFKALQKRGDIIKKVSIKSKSITLTKIGKDLSKQKISDDYIDALTPKMLKYPRQ